MGNRRVIRHGRGPVLSTPRISARDWERLSWHQRQRVLDAYAATHRPIDRIYIPAPKPRTPNAQREAQRGLSNREAIERVIQEDPACSIADICDLTGLASRTVQRHLSVIREGIAA